MSTEEENRRIDLVLDTVALYTMRLNASPTISGLAIEDRDLAKRIIAALHMAIERGEPFADDAEWYDAIGVEPPPEGALV